MYFSLSVRNDQGHRQRYNITIAHNCIQYTSIHHPPDIIFHHGRQRPSLEHCSATRCLHNPLLVAFSVVAALAPVGKAECHSFLSALRHNSRQVPEPNTCEGQCHWIMLNRCICERVWSCLVYPSGQPLCSFSFWGIHQDHITCYMQAVRCARAGGQSTPHEPGRPCMAQKHGK